MEQEKMAKRVVSSAYSNLFTGGTSLNLVKKVSAQPYLVKYFLLWSLDCGKNYVTKTGKLKCIKSAFISNEWISHIQF